jgi:hypothetical protein
MDTIWLASGKSGGGPPQSKTLPRRTVTRVNAKRLGLLQPSGALTKCAYVNMNCYMPRRRRCGGNEEGRRMNDETGHFRSLRGEVGLFPNGVAPSSGGNLVCARWNRTSSRRNLLRPPRNQASSARDLLGSGRNRSDPTEVKPELRNPGLLNRY